MRGQRGPWGARVRLPGQPVPIAGLFFLCVFLCIGRRLLPFFSLYPAWCCSAVCGSCWSGALVETASRRRACPAIRDVEAASVTPHPAAGPLHAVPRPAACLRTDPAPHPSPPCSPLSARPRQTVTPPPAAVSNPSATACFSEALVQTPWAPGTNRCRLVPPRPAPGLPYCTYHECKCLPQQRTTHKQKKGRPPPPPPSTHPLNLLQKKKKRCRIGSHAPPAMREERGGPARLRLTTPVNPPKKLRTGLYGYTNKEEKTKEWSSGKERESDHGPKRKERTTRGPSRWEKEK